MPREEPMPEELMYREPAPQRLPSDVYSSIIQEQKVSGIIQEINPERILIEVDHRLKGEIKDPDTGEWMKLTKPITNEICRSGILSILSSIFTQNTTLSNLSPNEINNIMFNLIEFLRDDMESNAESYDLSEKYSDITRVCDMVCYLVFTLLKRCQNGMEAKRLFDAIKIGEQQLINPYQDQKKSIWEKMKVW